MNALFRKITSSPLLGLVLVNLALLAVLVAFSGSHENQRTGERVHDFLNLENIFGLSIRPSYFAIMAVGATMVIISGGIDLSVGSVYALAGVGMGLILRAVFPAGAAPPSDAAVIAVALISSLGIGLLCGLINGVLTVGLRVHPFIITMGTMMIFRGLSAVISHAQSISLPDALSRLVRFNFGLGPMVKPVPALVMLLTAAAGAVYLARTVPGRHILAVGGNLEASRFAGLRTNRIVAGVYVLSGLAAGLAAFVGCGYYGGAGSSDATGYELFVIASAVVGGASLSGGRGSAIGAMLGAILIELIRKSITTLRFDQNYEWIIVGAAIIIAVVLDQASARWTARRLARDAAAAPSAGEQKGEMPV